MFNFIPGAYYLWVANESTHISRVTGSARVI